MITTSLVLFFMLPLVGLIGSILAISRQTRKRTGHLHITR